MPDTLLKYGVDPLGRFRDLAFPKSIFFQNQVKKLMKILENIGKSSIFGGNFVLSINFEKKLKKEVILQTRDLENCSTKSRQISRASQTYSERLPKHFLALKIYRSREKYFI